MRKRHPGHARFTRTGKQNMSTYHWVLIGVGLVILAVALVLKRRG
jgi:CHASE3 domain sensor protein